MHWTTQNETFNFRFINDRSSKTFDFDVEEVQRIDKLLEPVDELRWDSSQINENELGDWAQSLNRIVYRGYNF